MLTDTVAVNSYSELLVMCMHTYAHAYTHFIHVRHFNEHSATSVEI